MNTNELIGEIFKVEGFTVWIEDSSDDLRNYYKRPYDENLTVSDWKRRFKNRYNGLYVVVEKGNGYPANGNMLLKNIRSSYNLENLRQEINDLNDYLDNEKNKNKNKNKNINNSEDEEFDPYKVLGVDKDCEFSDIKYARARLSKFFHANKLDHYELHPDLLDFANKKQQEINIAYDQLKAIYKDKLG